MIIIQLLDILNNLLRERFGLAEYTEDMIDTVLGIFLVNDFDINNSVSEIQGLDGVKN